MRDGYDANPEARRENSESSTTVERISMAPAFVEEGLCAWDASPDWGNILARYRVNAALLPVDSALAAVLRERRDWEPVYQDQVAVFFEKTENER